MFFFKPKFVLPALTAVALAGCDVGSKPNFQVSTDSNGNAWVVDTRTGEAKRCWQGLPGVTTPTCYNAITENPKK